MDFSAKTYNELTKEELYEILSARSQIFIVEQKMNCQDMDGKDMEALHCILREDGKLVAYLRAFCRDPETVKIGRVLSVAHKKGLGTALMQGFTDYIRRTTASRCISLHAQKHAVGFYEKMGFRVTGGEFYEEGVLHLPMELALREEK